MAELVAAVRRTQSAAAPDAVASASTAGVAGGDQAAAAAPAAAAPSAPSLPTRAEVAREATIDNALSLNRMNLIGVYGSDSDRRALIRMPSGRLVKVKVGDRIDGGNVAAIGDDSLRYTKGGRNITLEVPSG
jgi:type IV pilus biogenesis protein PilP